LQQPSRLELLHFVSLAHGTSADEILDHRSRIWNMEVSVEVMQSLLRALMGGDVRVIEDGHGGRQVGWGIDPACHDNRVIDHRLVGIVSPNGHLVLQFEQLGVDNKLAAQVIEDLEGRRG
jgi:hypothetical protein